MELLGFDPYSLLAWALFFGALNIGGGAVAGALLAGAKGAGGKEHGDFFGTALGKQKAGQRLASSVHSALGFWTFIRIAWLESSLATDAATGAFVPMDAMTRQVHIELAFYAMDTVLDMVGWVRSGKLIVGDLIHHSVCLVGFVAYAAARSTVTVGDFLTGVMMCMHGTTPLLNVVWLLRKTGREDSMLATLVGLTFAIMFFFARVLLWPFSFYLYAKLRGIDLLPAAGGVDLAALWQLASGLSWYCRYGTLLMCGLNLFWFTGIMAQAIAVITGGSSKGKKRDAAKAAKD